MWKQLVAAAGISVALITGTGAVTSASGADTSTDTFPVSFSMSSDHCSEMPAGSTVEGEGTMTIIVNTHTDNSGVTRIIGTAQASGIAHDGDGNQYRFHYANIYRTANSAQQPDLYNGTMVDQFAISGAGPVRVSNGFRGTTVENFATGQFSVDPIWIKGDPRTFPDLAVRCDPL